MNMSKTYALPLKFNGEDARDANGSTVIVSTGDAVHAVNCHDDLVEALKQAKSWLAGWASAERELAAIDAVIAKSEGGQ